MGFLNNFYTVFIQVLILFIFMGFGFVGEKKRFIRRTRIEKISCNISWSKTMNLSLAVKRFFTRFKILSFFISTSIYHLTIYKDSKTERQYHTTTPLKDSYFDFLRGDLRAFSPTMVDVIISLDRSSPRAGEYSRP